MSETQFTIRRKIFTIAGAKFHLYSADGVLLGYCKQKAFKLKEDIRIYTDESMSEERLRIHARSIVDFGAGYDVIDSASEEKIGALRRKAMKSILKDEWIVMDEHDQQLGTISEDSAALALIRRFVVNLIPQTFYLKDNSGNAYVEFRNHFNPFVHKMTVTVYEGFPEHPLLALAAAVLLVAIEGKQD